MDDKISDENDVTFAAIKTALLNELTDGEFRAKRSLRALKHQEGRISSLENELGEKFNMLQELQESHTDLMEAHRYQTELQELQKHLIKLQEIQFLTEVVQPKMNEMGSKKEGNESTSQETFQQADLNDGKFNLQKKCTTPSALFKSWRTGSRQADTSHDRKNEEGSSATGNAILPLPESEDDRRMKFCSLKSRLGSMGSLLQCRNEKNKFLESPSPDNDDRSNYFPGINYQSGAFEDKKNFRMHTRQMSTSNVDKNDKILALKETLSLHKQSIEDLSSEVVYLREERSELLSHVQSLMEWKAKVENVLNVTGNAEDENGNLQEKDSLSKKEIDVILPVSRKSYRTMSNEDIALQSTNHSKHVRLNVSVKTDSDTGSEGGKNKDWDDVTMCNETSSKLEIRARRIWETSRKFFTPEQTHFILTASIPSDQEYESSAVEDY